MIIWQRWGIAVLAAIGLSVATGFVLAALFGMSGASEPVTSMFIGIGFLFGGLYTWLFWRFALVPHLDKPRVVTVPEEFIDDRGRTGVQQVSVVDSRTGEHLSVCPVSSLFCIPARTWIAILPLLGGAIIVIGAVQVA